MNSVNQPVNPVDVSHLPLTLSVHETAAELRVSPRTVYVLLAGDPPPLRSIKVGRRRLIPRAALAEYLVAREAIA